MEIALGTFAVVLAIVLGGYWAFVLRLEDQDRRSIRKRLKVGRATGVVRPDLLKSEQPLSRVGAVDRVLKHTRGFSGSLQQQIEWSGLPVTVGVVVLGSVCLGAVVFRTAFVLTRLITAGPVLGVLAMALPFLFLRIKARRRIAT